VAKHKKVVPGRPQLGVVSTNRTAAASFYVEVRREQNYDTGDRVACVQSHIPKLTPEQKGNYEQIMQNVNNGVGELVFVDAPGGTGKTFLRKLIQAAIRSHNDIAVALASSGIAATLLPGGRTALSALKVPLNMQCTETPTCNISMLRVPASVAPE
jgi:hypothetical protein